VDSIQDSEVVQEARRGVLQVVEGVVVLAEAVQELVVVAVEVN
jgi:hypothetical protein